MHNAVDEFPRGHISKGLDLLDLSYQVLLYCKRQRLFSVHVLKIYETREKIHNFNTKL